MSRQVGFTSSSAVFHSPIRCVGGWGVIAFFSSCRFVPRSCYQMINMDTDSSYVALAGPLHSLIPDSLLEEFLDNYDRWYVQPFCPDHKEAFKCRLRRREEWSTANECCRVYQLWDSRTPGKFKVEFQGSVICALNAKTYICHKEGADQTQSATKLSSKGLSKRTNRLTVEDYKKVLADRTPVRGINTGFVRKNNTTYTYKQIKTGLTYFYCKRRVLPDGVSTTHIEA